MYVYICRLKDHIITNAEGTFGVEILLGKDELHPVDKAKKNYDEGLFIRPLGMALASPI